MTDSQSWMSTGDFVWVYKMLDENEFQVTTNKPSFPALASACKVNPTLHCNNCTQSTNI